MLEQRSFGVTCQSCRKPFSTGSVWLERDAAEKDLRDVVAAVVGVVHSGVCPACQAANKLQIEALQFVAAA